MKSICKKNIPKTSLLLICLERMSYTCRTRVLQLGLRHHKTAKIAIEKIANNIAIKYCIYLYTSFKMLSRQ